MAEYRVFEQNPITNEWIDRGWAEGSGQQDVLRREGKTNCKYFVVPKSSYHPVSMAPIERVAWVFEGDDVGAPGDDSDV